MVLEAAGSSLQNVVKVTVFLTSMEDYAAMNKAYESVFKDSKPVSFSARNERFRLTWTVSHLRGSKGIALAD